MPQEPKKRHSRQRQGKRRHSINFEFLTEYSSENCGANNMPHVICKKCGFYQGRQVLNLEKKVKNKDEEPAGPQA